MIFELLCLYAAYRVGKYAGNPESGPLLVFRGPESYTPPPSSPHCLAGGHYTHYRFAWRAGLVRFKVKASQPIHVLMLTTEGINHWLTDKIKSTAESLIPADTWHKFEMNVTAESCKYILLHNPGKHNATFKVKF
jgi:hypothetical protein